MKRTILAIVLTLGLVSGAGLSAHPAFAASVCVGSGPGCYSTIQAALTAAHDGDIVHIGPGTFAGGITIDASVSLIGAGAGRTIIEGGGPVLTIGSSDATTEPNVSITRITITGGLNTSVPDPSQPRGGGIWVPPAAGGGPGATVSLQNSIITGNAVRASTTGDCGPGCTFAFSRGGGIDSFGTMTLTNSVVSNNQSIGDLAPAPSFGGSFGGGIKNNGSLTLRHSTISGNIATFTTAGVYQNGRSGEGGGIDTNGPLTMEDSAVSGNAVNLTSTSTDPTSGVFGVGGGISVIENGGSASIRDSVISGNSIAATGYTGGNGDGGGGIDADGPLLLEDSTVQANRATTAVATPQLGVPNGPSGAGIEVDAPATVKGTTISDNHAAVTGNAAIAFVLGGAFDNGSGQTVTFSDSTITGNTGIATTSSGTVFLEGAAIHNDAGTMTLRSTVVSKNSGIASGASGLADGGGIYNGPATFFCPDCTSPPPHQLIVDDSAITQNSVSATSGNITVHGGGVFNDTSQQATATMNDSAIARNVPDQCFGC
jgi:hypothetical protein